jgi:uncharacterized phage protein (TIGR02218 family)
MPKTTDVDVLKYLYMGGKVILTGYKVSINAPDDTCYVANNKNITYGDTYIALALKRNAIRSEDGTVLNEVEIGLDNVDLRFKENVMMGKYNNKRCKIVLLIVNPGGTVALTSLTIFDGFIDEPKGDEHWVSFQIRPFSILEREYPNRIFQTNCNWIFCDTNCKLNITNYRTDTTLTATSDGRILTCTHNKGADYFVPGFVQIRSGTYNGFYRPIQTNDYGTVTMRIPFPGVIVNGTSIRITKLCARDPASCINLFNNYDNFGGFPHCPKTPVL